MFELEISNQSHSILLLRNELNNKDIEIVELKGQLQDLRIKMERLVKEKEKQIRDKNIANSRYNIFIYSTHIIISAQLKRGVGDENANSKCPTKGPWCSHCTHPPPPPSLPF